jgi:hypothetical protein
MASLSGGGGSFIILGATQHTTNENIRSNDFYSDCCGGSKWIRDGSEGGALDVNTSASTSTITFASATQGTPFNVRLEKNNDPSLKDSYYEIRVTDASRGASIGVGYIELLYIYAVSKAMRYESSALVTQWMIVPSIPPPNLFSVTNAL